MQTLKKELKELMLRVETAIDRLGIKADQEKLAQMQKQMQQADFWDDPAAAASFSQEAAGLEKHIEEWQGLRKEVEMALELANMGDQALANELGATLKRLQSEYHKREFELKLSGKYDRSGAILSIYAGTGGTDAQDWTEMLLRMYLRYCEKAGFSVEIIDRSDGEEAGIKSVTLEITGAYAYGKLRSEKGVHRLVRLSPFNANNLRQTSFALVDVIPKLDRPEEVEIDDKDLRIDVFRSGGHGGQSVNTTDSAVRVTHNPTGTVVTIQNERSQLQNKEKALEILKARLSLMAEEQHLKELSQLRGTKQSAEWGNQIRSYVLHPYTKVKDHRTQHETSQAQAVLAGELEGFIQAYLSSRVGK